jgi:hypothetical protein
MWSDLKQSWRTLERGAPGRRFRQRYAEAQRRLGVPLWHRVLRMVVAGLLVVVGVVFVFMPGPAIIFFALAGALVATESHAVARALDGGEVRVRGWSRRRLRDWRRGSWLERGLVVAGGVALAALGLWAAGKFYTR